MGAGVVNNNVQVSGIRKWINSGFYGPESWEEDGF